jgi:cytochrome c oxidase subunit 4
MTDAPSRMHGEPEEPHDVSRPEPDHHSPYFTVFIVLVVLTAATVAIAQYRFPHEIINVLLALLVACLKAGCVAMIFMHLRYEGKLIYLIAIVPLILCVLLVTSLIPDILMTAQDSNSASLHVFNPPPIQQAAAENAHE